MFKFKPKKAFTLIELLVVIAIIGILVTVAVVALNNARAKARDSKRLANIKQVQTALELFYNDMNRYPTQEEFNSGALFSTSTGATTTYMVRIPDGPNPPDGTCTPEQNTLTYIAPTDGTSYTLSYCLGGPAGSISSGPHCATPAGIADGSSCGSGGGLECTQDSDCTGNNICIVNFCVDHIDYGVNTNLNYVCDSNIGDTCTYNVIKIGTQYWLKENINVGDYIGSGNSTSGYNDILGDEDDCVELPPGSDRWSCQGASGIQKYCYGIDGQAGGNINNCATDGGLYEWAEMMGFPRECNDADFTDNGNGTYTGIGNCAGYNISIKHQGICPTGWHIPGDSELGVDSDWRLLEQYSGTAGCDSLDTGCPPAGEKLKASSTSTPIFWDGTNDFNFTVVPAGRRHANGLFYGRGDNAYLRASMPFSDSINAWFRYLYSGGSEIYRDGTYRINGLSVRCLKD